MKLLINNVFLFIFVIKKKLRNPEIFRTRIIPGFRYRDYEIPNTGIFKNQFRLASLVYAYNSAYIYLMFK